MEYRHSIRLPCLQLIALPFSSPPPPNKHLTALSFSLGTPAIISSSIPRAWDPNLWVRNTRRPHPSKAAYPSPRHGRE